MAVDLLLPSGVPPVIASVTSVTSGRGRPPSRRTAGTRDIHTDEGTRFMHGSKARRRPTRHVARKIAVTAAGMLALTACGSGTTGGTGTTSDSQLTEVAQAVSAAREVPTWKAPGPELDAAALRGKHIFVIPITSQSAFEVQVEKADREIASKLGIELTFYTNQGTVAEWVQGMNAAIAAKPDLIFLESAPDPRQLAPQLKAAEDAGIPVVASHIWDANDPNPPDCTGCEGLDAIVRGPFADAGTMMADAVIDDSEGKANVLMVGIQGINSGDIVDKAERAEYEKNCPGCKVKEVSLTLDQIGGGTLQAVTSALTSDPTITHIVPTFDILAAGVIASMNTANRSEIKVVSFGGTSDVMAMLADPDSPVIADVAEPIAWTAYANLDQAFRLMLGMDPVLEATPARLFDKDNVSEAGDAPSYAEGFGSDFVDGFLELWQVAG
jgi:ribose transport system substrate-binding protein